MIFNSGSLLMDFLGVLVAIVVATIAYFKWTFQYWKNRNLPYLQPTIPFGNLPIPYINPMGLGTQIKNLYFEIKRKQLKHAGIFMFASPVYFPVDLDYIKNIMTKDFDHFTDRGVFYNEEDDPLSAHLLAVGGTKWRSLRTKLTPTFTSGKMRAMFQTLIDCETPLIEAMKKLRGPIDIKELAGRFTTDIIGSCAFGLECNTFESEDSPFRLYGKKAFEFPLSRRIQSMFNRSFPGLAKIMRVTTTPRDVAEFFMTMVKDTVEYREVNKVVRKDFLQLLLEIKNEENDEKGLSLEEIAAQCFLFFLAGFETSSTAMTFTLYELASNPQIQEKLRREILEITKKHGGEITYDSISEMKYMNQVIDESMRKHPPAPFVMRQCVKDYKMSDFLITKGTRVMIPIYGIHHDEDYYPDPQKFDPERFNDENKRGRHQYAHMPFGEGPRNCIGMRFGLMQIKVGLTALLRHYKFSVNEKTQEPLEMDADALILSAKGDVWLNAEEI